MTANLFQKLVLSAALLTGVFISPAQAQKEKSEKTQPDQKASIRIKVTEEKDGNVENKERSYRIGKLTDKQREEFVDKVLDSMGVDKKKNQTVSVTIDDGDDSDIISKKRQKVIIDHRDDREPLAYHWKGDISNDFEFNTENFRKHMKTFENEWKPKTKTFMRDMENFGNEMGEIWNKEVTKPASIRSLNAYTNNPDNGVLNLRFNVPQKGDVSVVVTDTKGKEIGKRDIKDFEGEFVGQIELRKNTKGTVFVTVVQNEDGAVKRVVIP
ncbi:T9SS C-terminal target domain-containing protein [Dyadobacter sp. CY326]|uniref:T9SS C-terminal target domain-containing protein n=1 Tax=Dyadobacter sp. CY326 TaxID=2907300 RepID=UPI001F18E919|nr:T9SS C-terminal target domain-containing protein [Dyadobacter sp. CY326]MCE7067272.1 T9SS C-terminal target domain-containing protein [Dyadobacter sp. CY326]